METQVGTLDNVASFQPGFWKGRYYSPEFVKQLADNFAKYSKGGEPYYIPFNSINHKDEYRHGEIVDAWMEGDTLKLKCDKLPEFVADDIKAKRLASCSIEFWEPREVEGKWEGFVDAAGNRVQTPVIRCLSWLGAEAPAVKGLGRLPEPTMRVLSKFSESGTGRAVAKFSDQAKGKPMKPELLEQLKTLGFDVTKLPADADDALAEAIIAAIQAARANPTPAPVPDPGQMSDTGNGAPPNANVLAAAPSAGGLGLNPSQITTVTKFFDEAARSQAAAILGVNAKTLNQLAATNAALVRTANEQAAQAKLGVITRFFDECGLGAGKTGQVTPAMRPALLMTLSKCDFTTVRKFADGKTTGSELDEAIAGLKASLPVNRTAGPNLTQPGVTHPANGGGTTLTPERRAAILGGTSAGKQLLTVKKS